MPASNMFLHDTLGHANATAYVTLLLQITPSRFGLTDDTHTLQQQVGSITSSPAQYRAALAVIHKEGHRYIIKKSKRR